jgi:hypothetical protein
MMQLNRMQKPNSHIRKQTQMTVLWPGMRKCHPHGKHWFLLHNCEVKTPSNFFNRRHPVVYLISNEMGYSVLTQIQYISFLATCFGFYKTIFKPMLTIGRYIQCVHPIVFTQNHNNYKNFLFKNASLRSNSTTGLVAFGVSGRLRLQNF